MYWIIFLSAYQRLEKVVCFKISWRLRMCGVWGFALVRWCPSPTPSSPTVPVNGGTLKAAPVSPNPPLNVPENKVPGRKAQDGPKLFKKGYLEASMFFFNPTLILELLIARTQELIATVYLSISFLSFCISAFLLLTLFSQNICFEGFSCSVC